VGTELNSLLLHPKEPWGGSPEETGMARYITGRVQIIQAPSRPALFNLIYCDYLFMVNILKAVECVLRTWALKSDKSVV